MHLRRTEARMNGGFTLIELLIVIVILGILAAIVVFAVSSTRKDSVQASCKTDVKSIVLAAEAYRTKKGSYASASSSLLDANGGLLNNWPDSDNYTLTYNGSPGNFTLSGSGKISGTPILNKNSSMTQITSFCAA